MTALKRLFQVLPYARVLRPRGGRRSRNLFDPDYYRTRYPDVAAAGVNPLLHFIVAGAFEGRQPHPLFDTAFYLRKYPDVAAANANPLGHYLKHGGAEGRQPHPLFDPAYYLERYPDVRGAGVNPLVHYVLYGAAEGRKPHPLFQPDYYLSRCPEARRRGNPLAHFLESRGSCCSPHPLFDCESYLRANPDAAAQGANPLVHYVLLERGKEQGAGAFAGTFQVAHLDIQDVNLVIVFLDTAFDSKTAREQQEMRAALESCAARAGLAGNVVPVWQDRSGRTRFMAPPQQQPFFQIMSYDQLRAQANRTLSCG